MCPICKTRERAVKLFKGKPYTLKYCRSCRKTRYDKPYLAFRKDKCDYCGFVPLNACQLDVDHINGNHKDNNPSNLQTLCANCHRLKTFNQRWGQG